MLSVGSASMIFLCTAMLVGTCVLALICHETIDILKLTTEPDHDTFNKNKEFRETV